MHRTGLVAVLAFTAALSAQAQQSGSTTTQVGTPVQVTGQSDRGFLPGTRTTAQNTIEGTALDSSNAPLRRAAVRLRDARYGRIVASQQTDAMGQFAFRNVDPGTYIVELVDKDKVLAASPLLNVDSGDIATAILKLPFRIPPGGGFFGTTTASVAAIAAAAAAAGVIANEVTGIEASPTQVTP